jgi:hypothetical protein
MKGPNNARLQRFNARIMAEDRSSNPVRCCRVSRTSARWFSTELFLPSGQADSSESLAVTCQAELDVAVEVQHIRLKPSLKMVALSVLLLGAVVSFIAGSLLGEDSTGDMSGDFYCNHWYTIERFSRLPWSKAVTDYYNPENPLLYMMASLLPLHGDPKTYHVITFAGGLLTWLLLSWAYLRRYAKYGIDWLWATFGASAILMSPTFRSSTFWGDTDWLPFAFCAGTSLFLSRIQDPETGKARTVGAYTLVTLAAVSACAFYTRQYYAFLPVFAAWIVLTRTTTSRLFIFGVFFVAALPELFLIYLWKGLVPPMHQGENFHPALLNFWKVGAVGGFLSFPILIGCIRRSLSDTLPEWWGPRSTGLAVAGLLVFIMGIMALGPPEWSEKGWGGGGGGIVVKAGLEMGALGTPFILTASYAGLVAAVLFAVRSATNGVLAGSYLVPLFLTAPTYQRYLEPSLVVALFLFADTQTARVLFNKRVLIYNWVFTALLLTTGIVYYDLLHHAADIHSSSECGDPHFPLSI